MDNHAGGNLLSILQLPYQEIFDTMPGYALIVDQDFMIVQANRRFANEFGQGRGRKCHKALRDSNEPCENCHVQKTFSTGEQQRGESTLINKDGQEIHAVINTVPIKNGNGQVAAVMETITDVTSIVRLKNELEKSQQQYHDLFDGVPCYISVQDKDLRIVSANRKFREDFGLEDGAHCYKTYKHRDEPCMVCPVLATFRDNKEHSREEVVTNRHGEKRNVLVKSSPIRNGDGNVEYVMEMSSDITEVRQLQDQLQSLGLLVGSISHGIKGVLTGLDGGVYVMNSGFKKDDMGRIKKGWDMIQRNVNRIRSMVLDILYYAKDREPNWEAVDARVVLEDVCNILQPKAEEKGFTFTRDFDDTVGEFEADSKAIHSMLVNLLENSIDACRTDKTKDEHDIHVSLKQDSDHVLFDIRDNGTGMDQETREKLFSLFFSSKGTEGTGLGLFISNKIAQKHGGIIVVESEPGHGAHFTVRIPKRVPEDMKQRQEIA